MLILYFQKICIMQNFVGMGFPPVSVGGMSNAGIHASTMGLYGLPGAPGFPQHPGLPTPGGSHVGPPGFPPGMHTLTLAERLAGEDFFRYHNHNIVKNGTICTSVMFEYWILFNYSLNNFVGYLCCYVCENHTLIIIIRSDI